MYSHFEKFLEYLQKRLRYLKSLEKLLRKTLTIFLVILPGGEDFVPLRVGCHCYMDIIHNSYSLLRSFNLLNNNHLYLFKIHSKRETDNFI